MGVEWRWDEFTHLHVPHVPLADEPQVGHVYLLRIHELSQHVLALAQDLLVGLGAGRAGLLLVVGLGAARRDAHTARTVLLLPRTNTPIWLPIQQRPPASTILIGRMGFGLYIQLAVCKVGSTSRSSQSPCAIVINFRMVQIYLYVYYHNLSCGPPCIYQKQKTRNSQR